MVVKHIFEELAPDRDPQDIIEAVERSLASPSTSGETEQRYRRAADVGHTNAMYNLANLLRRAGRGAEAEQWYLRAADAGHAKAVDTLAELLRPTERIEEAEQADRRATAEYCPADLLEQTER